jgi:hypothetical protein
MQRLVDRGYPVRQLQRWCAAVDHVCRVGLLSRPSGARERHSSQPPVLVLPDGQFEMTANITAVLNRVYAAHKHHPAVATIFGGSNARLANQLSTTALHCTKHMMMMMLLLLCQLEMCWRVSKAFGGGRASGYFSLLNGTLHTR